MSFRFKSQDAPLDEVIFGIHQLRVPQFQRPYSWEEDQCSDLWVDLTDDESLFLGQFILNYEYLDSEKFVDIVDGQQRVTTILILCAVLRNKATELGFKDDADVIQDNAIVARKSFTGPEFRITVSPSLKEFFENYIQRGDKIIDETIKGSTDEEVRVIKNYLFIRDQLEREIADNPPSIQIEVIRKIFEQVKRGQVIQTKIFDENDAYEIFETVNATGVDLNVADLLKNFLYKKLRGEGATTSEIAEKWEELVSNVNDASLDIAKFIRYYWLSKYEFTSDAKLFRAIKNKNLASWKQFLQDLVDNSKAISELRNPLESDFSQIQRGEKLKSALVGIKEMNITQCYVLLLAIYRNKDKLNTNWVSAFELIEKFNFLYHTISKLPANKVERAYQDFAVRLEKLVIEEKNAKAVRVGIETILNNLKTKLLSLVPQEEIFEAGFKSLSYKKKGICRYVLSKIEDSLGINSGEYVLNHASLTIEHVLPQKPGTGWGLTQNDIKSYVHNIGNLTLLGKKPNGSIQNRSIEEKIELLRGATEIQMTLDLLQEIEANGKKWNKELIEERAKMLARLSYQKVWAIK